MDNREVREVGSGLCVVLSQSRTDIDFQLRDDGMSSVMGRKQTEAPVMGTPHIYMLGDRRHLGRHLGRRQDDSGAFLARIGTVQYRTGRLRRGWVVAEGKEVASRNKVS